MHPRIERSAADANDSAAVVSECVPFLALRSVPRLAIVERIAARRLGVTPAAERMRTAQHTHASINVYQQMLLSDGSKQAGLCHNKGGRADNGCAVALEITSCVA
jgi:hypothetical protein